MNRLESLKFLNYFKRTSFKHVFSDITKGPKIVSVRLSSDHDDHHHHHMRPAREVDIEQKTTLNDIPVPSGSWQESYNAKQSKYNMYLLLSVGAFVASGFVIYKYGLFNLYTSPHRSAVGTDFPGAKFVTPSSARFVSAVRDPQSKEPATVVPPTKEEPVNYAPVPEHAPYLIIGGGTAAFSAFRSIRANDPKAKVLVISQEKHKPYMRPPLSKELWFSDNPLKEYKFKQWNGKEKSVFYLHDEFFVEPMQLSTSENGGVAIVNNRKVARLDVQHKKAILENGAEVSFDKCLIATGGRPHNIQSLEEASAEVRQRTTLFRSLDDFERLYNLTKKVKSVAIIGGGFLGSELACALGRKSTETGAKVTQILMESGNMGKVLPTYLSKWTTNKVRGEGVDVVTNVKVTRATFKNGKVALELSNGQETLVDHVIVAVGIDANVELAKQAGLEVDRELGGYHVNAELEARTGVWVAGDAACFYDIKLGRRRVEHHDHAVVSGRLAGENMTGNHKPYWHQSMFWSDLGPEVGYEAIGLVDSSLPTVGVFAKKTDKDTPRAVVEETGESLRSETESVAKPGDESPSVRTPMPDDDYGKGVIFYQKNNVVVGILLWNIFNRMPIARKIIKDQQPVDDFTELAKLFNIHGEE